MYKPKTYVLNGPCGQYFVTVTCHDTYLAVEGLSEAVLRLPADTEKLGILAELIAKELNSRTKRKPTDAEIRELCSSIDYGGPVDYTWLGG